MELHCTCKSDQPSNLPSSKPSKSIKPSENPSLKPSDKPSSKPSNDPSTSLNPSKSPSKSPSSSPSNNPSTSPTGSSILIVRNTKIDTTTNPPITFILSFQIYPQGIISNWGSIKRYTSTTGNMESYGDRWCAMWFHANSYRISFVAGTTSSPNANFDNIQGIVRSTWNDVRVDAVDHEIKLYINNVYKGTLSNTNRPQVTHLDVYVGDGGTAANAMIRDLTFTPVL